MEEWCRCDTGMAATIVDMRLATQFLSLCCHVFPLGDLIQVFLIKSIFYIEVKNGQPQN